MQGKLLDVDRRVGVAVVVRTTVRADPLSIREFQIPLEIPTPIADFRRRLEPPDLEKRLSVFPALVFQHREECTPRYITENLARYGGEARRTCG